jgi:hypothetical protein
MNLFRSFGIFCLLISTCAIGCGGGSLKNIAFSRSDSEGPWKLVGCGYEYRKPYCSSGSLIMSASGDVRGGDLINFGVDKRSFIRGTLEISDKGFVNGTVYSYLADTDKVEDHVMLDGQMTFDKNMVVYAGTAPITNNGIGILLKESGSFSLSDLEGVWIFPLTQKMFYISLGKTGDILDCSFSHLTEDTQKCGGKFSISPKGSVSGNIKSLTGNKFTMNFNGQMNANKGSMIFAGAISTRFEGAATLGIKKGGNLASSAMQGRWRIFHASHKEILHGEITFDRSGAVIGGRWNEVSGGSGTFSQGSFSVSQEGSISGSLRRSANLTYTVYDGQMASVSDIATALDKDNSGNLGVVILVRIHD